MPTTVEILDTSYPVVSFRPQPALTLLPDTNYDGCWTASGTLEFAVDDAPLAANPINRVDWTGLVAVDAPVPSSANPASFIAAVKAGALDVGDFVAMFGEQAAITAGLIAVTNPQLTQAALDSAARMAKDAHGTGGASNQQAAQAAADEAKKKVENEPCQQEPPPSPDKNPLDDNIAKHASEQGHWPGKTIDEIKQIIEDVRTNYQNVWPPSDAARRCFIKGDTVLIEDGSGGGTIFKPTPSALDYFKTFVEDNPIH